MVVKFSHTAEVLEQFAIEVRNLYQDNLILNDRFASGKLLNSVEYITHFGGKDYWVSLKLEDYWKFVEQGVNGTEQSQNSPFSFKGDFVNVDAILNWIRVKPILPTPKNGKKLPTPESLAWAISRSMARKGIEGSHDLEDALLFLNERFNERLMDAIDKDITFMMRAFIIEPVIGIFKGDYGDDSTFETPTF